MNITSISSYKICKVLKDLEWSGTYSYCTGWRCCPLCRGIKPGVGRDDSGLLPDNQGHKADCRLAEIINEIS